MAANKTSQLIDRLTEVDAQIVAIAKHPNPETINRIHLTDLLWEATNLSLEITLDLCDTQRLWADLDLMHHVWIRFAELVRLCRRVGVLELAIGDISTLAKIDSEILFITSELVDDRQLDLLAKPKDEQIRANLAKAVDELAYIGDLWMVHGLTTRFDLYAEVAHAVFIAIQRRCEQERQALIVN